jgi:uncharacterized coiled-coil protein SlyX
MDSEERREIGQVDQRVTAIGDKMDALRNKVTEMDKEEGRCQQHVQDRFEDIDLRMNSQNTDIQNRITADTIMQGRMAGLQAVDAAQEKHICNTDATVAEHSATLKAHTKAINDINMRMAYYVGAASTVMAGITVLANHFWK